MAEEQAGRKREIQTLGSVGEYERCGVDLVDPEVWHYFQKGSGDELTLRDNLAAYERYRLRPRVLVDVSEVSLETSVLGTTLSMPLLIAPFALQRLLDPDGELATARAAAEAETIMCVSSAMSAYHGEIRDAAPRGSRWLQLYVLRDRERTRQHLQEAVESGYTAVAVTVDTPYDAKRRNPESPSGMSSPPLPAGIPMPYVGPRHDDDPNGSYPTPALTWHDIEWVAAETGLPVLVKGILTGEDAVLACAHGVAGIIVSNHGGRQLDGAIAAIDALAEVADAVAGRCDVLVDGGIRRGSDVVKALALGARAVMVGRPIAYGLAVGGEAGVRHVLELLRGEMLVALGLLGCRSTAEVTSAHVSAVRR